MGLHPMHVKSDSETSIEAASTSPRSPRRPLYYVQSPSHSQQLSFGSSPFASPPHNHHGHGGAYHYHCSPIHHSRESSTSRFSAAMKNPNKGGNAMMAWKRMEKDLTGLRPLNGLEDDGDDDEEGDEDGEHGERGGEKGHGIRFYIAWFLLGFVFMFSLFTLILWASSLPYKPKVFVKSIVFENFNVQAGMDRGGVPTDMLTLNSTVRVFFRNPATFFGVSVVSTPLELHFLELKLASGEMEKFYEPRKSQRTVAVVVQGHQVPLYGGVPSLGGSKSHIETTAVAVNLTFYMRSRANILGGLVNTKFDRSIWCEVVLRGGDHLGKRVNLTNSDHCVYR